MSPECDVAVIGGGMAGLSAGVRASQLGAKVTIIEKAPQPGGTVPYMGGFLWTANDVETFLSRMVHGDPALADLAVNSYEESISWLAEIGVHLGPRNNHFFDWGKGYRMVEGPQEYVQVMSDYLRDHDAMIVTDASARTIAAHSDGSVAALRYGKDGREQSVDCAAVIIASGGFQANHEMTTRYLGRWADRMFVRATPWSTGDGIEMAAAIGARMSKGYHAFYGQLMPAPPTKVQPEDFRFVTQYNSIHMIALNIFGERFIDESIYDSLTAQALSRQPFALGYLVTDSQIDQHDLNHPATPTSSMAPTERMRHIVSRGGVVLEAQSFDELGLQLEQCGMYRQGFDATIEEFNRAALERTASELAFPKSLHAHPIVEPPFYAIPVVPGISFTHGAISVNHHMEVLDWRGEPVRGLFAAGVDAGGLFYEQYLGGAASSLVMGRTSGTNAANYVLTSLKASEKI